MTTTTTAPLTDAEVRAMVDAWYKGLDVHAPAEDMTPFVHETDLQMRFPEATLTTVEEFRGWYEGVIRIFFDEVHTLQKLDVNLNEDGSSALVNLVVYWEASRWKAPAAKSERLLMDADQTWEVRRSPASGQPVIAVYIVNALTPRPGSVEL
ncbi:hypothetical protein [Deinococcus yavapaiensis]|uniref:SnoaL-like protein n=1 Tax=Deinococcus yavapaiensis KR-236 TaxID=694435 RepID=A0A318SBX6_9DEIO|nr:hypothetical protein [Deinococcus yavapaiensis]PYE54804.1 hypothetical protein DES52_10474 [Deinococcus yavapaiensis KR-236]